MRDQVFTGRDLAEALALASRALGVRQEALRYIVLDDPASVSGPSSVRVAVLMERGARGAPLPPAPLSGLDGVREALAALSRAAALELMAELVEGEGTVEVRLGGAGVEALLEGGGDTVRALDHVLRKTLQLGGDDRHFTLTCEGYKELREAALRERAQALAGAVLADGRTRHTEPLNSYERRIVHVALSEFAGIRTSGIGTGNERCVAIARVGPRPEDEQ